MAYICLAKTSLPMMQTAPPQAQVAACFSGFGRLLQPRGHQPINIAALSRCLGIGHTILDPRILSDTICNDSVFSQIQPPRSLN